MSIIMIIMMMARLGKSARATPESDTVWVRDFQSYAHRRRGGAAQPRGAAPSLARHGRARTSAAAGQRSAIGPHWRRGGAAQRSAAPAPASRRVSAARRGARTGVGAG
jgi:hypothetical protein